MTTEAALEFLTFLSCECQAVSEGETMALPSSGFSKLKGYRDVPARPAGSPEAPVVGSFQYHDDPGLRYMTRADSTTMSAGQRYEKWRLKL